MLCNWLSKGVLALSNCLILFVVDLVVAVDFFGTIVSIGSYGLVGCVMGSCVLAL